jgi:hypothetical protein
VTPLDEIARLLARWGHASEALTVHSLAAREEMRVEGEAFWADLAGAAVFGAEGSIASLQLGGPGDPESEELARDRARLRRALFLVADDLSLRGVASPESEAWRLRWREQRS